MKMAITKTVLSHWLYRLKNMEMYRSLVRIRFLFPEGTGTGHHFKVKRGGRDL